MGIQLNLAYQTFHYCLRIKIVTYLISRTVENTQTLYLFYSKLHYFINKLITYNLVKYNLY